MGEGLGVKKCGILFVLAENDGNKNKNSFIEDLTMIKELAITHGFEKIVVPNPHDSKEVIARYNSNIGSSVDRYKLPLISLVDAKLISLADAESNGYKAVNPDKESTGYKLINGVLAYFEDKINVKKGSTVIVYGTDIEIRSRISLEKELGVKLVRKANKINPNEFMKTKDYFFAEIAGRRDFFVKERDNNNIECQKAAAEPIEAEEAKEFRWEYNNQKCRYTLSGALEKNDDAMAVLNNMRDKLLNKASEGNKGKLIVDVSGVQRTNDTAMGVFVQLPGVLPAHMRFIELIGFEKFKGSLNKLIYSSLLQKYSSNAK